MKPIFDCDTWLGSYHVYFKNMQKDFDVDPHKKGTLLRNSVYSSNVQNKNREDRFACLI